MIFFQFLLVKNLNFKIIIVIIIIIIKKVENLYWNQLKSQIVFYYRNFVEFDEFVKVSNLKNRQDFTEKIDYYFIKISFFLEEIIAQKNFRLFYFCFYKQNLMIKKNTTHYYYFNLLLIGMDSYLLIFIMKVNLIVNQITSQKTIKASLTYYYLNFIKCFKQEDSSVCYSNKEVGFCYKKFLILDFSLQATDFNLKRLENQRI